jgi:DNA invertase Pin-like site-specific DNA recombinase
MIRSASQAAVVRIDDRVRLGSASPGRHAAIPVVGYASIPGGGGPRANGDLRSQTASIVSACARRGLSLVEVVREREPTRGHALDRPGLGYALELISAGEAEGLVVTDLSRLTRSVPELGRVLEWLSGTDARLVAATPGLDTGDDGGRLTARMIIELSHWERERLIERTRKGMQEARRKGPPSVADYPELKERIAAMRAEGMTLQAIADRLNAEGVPTVRGGAEWRPSSVQAAAGYRRPVAVATFGRPRVV